MRPPGEIREALRVAFAERGPSTWRDVLHQVPAVNAASPSECSLVRRTAVNMMHAGELIKVGTSREAGSRVARTLYELAPDGEHAVSSCAARADEASQALRASLDALRDATRGWAEFN